MTETMTEIETFNYICTLTRTKDHHLLENKSLLLDCGEMVDDCDQKCCLNTQHSHMNSTPKLQLYRKNIHMIDLWQSFSLFILIFRLMERCHGKQYGNKFEKKRKLLVYFSLDLLPKFLVEFLKKRHLAHVHHQYSWKTIPNQCNSTTLKIKRHCPMRRKSKMLFSIHSSKLLSIFSFGDKSNDSNTKLSPQFKFKTADFKTNAWISKLSTIYSFDQCLTFEFFLIDFSSCLKSKKNENHLLFLTI